MDVYILGIYMTKLGKFPEKTVKQFTAEAVAGAVEDAGVKLEDIEAAWFSNTRQALMEGQNSVRGQIALRAAGLDRVPIINVENACASSSTGLNQAVAGIKSGAYETVLVSGTEKMVYPNVSKEMAFKAFMGGTDISTIEETRELFKQMGQGVGPQETSDSDSGSHTFFMDMYAAQAKLHSRHFGTTQRQIASAAAKNHFHSTMNPLSQYQSDMSVDEVLNDKPVTWPLTRAMCAPLSDGASAAIICSAEKVKALGLEDRAIRVAASSIVSGMVRDPSDFANSAGRRAADKAYQMAGVGPEDMHVAEVHDATSFGEIQQIENLGLCAVGEGGPTTERGETTLGGRIPVNTSGGLVSKGHPIAATGIIQLHELVTQLRGEAGARQVEGARFAVSENGGGFVGVEDAATTVTILAKD